MNAVKNYTIITIHHYKSCGCKCKFDGRKCNSSHWWISNKCWCECKQHHLCGKDYISNPATCSCKNDKYLGSIMNDSPITCDEFINAEAKLYDKETKAVPTDFNEKSNL